MVRKLIGFTLVVGIWAPLAPAQSGENSATSVAADSAWSSSSDVRSVLEQVQTLVRAQAQQLESQRQQLERQQLAIDALQRELAVDRTANSSATEQAAASTVARLNSEAHALNVAPSFAASSTFVAPKSSKAAESAPQTTAAKSPDSPLSIHFGKASLTPGGWVDFTAIYRSTDVGSGLGTSFASIPFSNTVTGGLSETRFTAQSSRITLRADELFGAAKIFGYAEADFNGYLPSNAYVSTNSDSLRLRVYFTDLSRKRWELLAGQSWSLLTPNRVGISPFLSEIYNTLHLDTNYQVGLTYARQAQCVRSTTSRPTLHLASPRKILSSSAAAQQHSPHCSARLRPM